MKLDLNKKRWLILAACCITNLCIGSMYVWSVFAGPIAARLTTILGHSVTTGELAIVFTLANAVGPFAQIFGGAINDRLGSRWVCLGGGLVFGSGILLTGRATGTAGLIVSFGLMAGLGMGFIYSCTVGTCVKYFPDKRGLVGGLSVATYGLSAVIVPLVAAPLIDARGIAHTMTLLGVAFGAIICLCATVLDRCPDNFAPAGWTPPSGVAGHGAAEKNWAGMLREPIFYVMISMLIFGAFSGLMILSQASPIAQSMAGLSAKQAAGAVSILALFNTGGRILAGYVSDKIGRINCLSGVFVLAAAGLLLLFSIGPGSPAMLFYIGLCIAGICFGAIMGVFPGFTADRFGAKNNSVNYGIMFFGFGLAGFFGPVIMSRLHAATGTYRTAFLIAAGLALLGLLCTFLYRRMEATHTTRKG